MANHSRTATHTRWVPRSHAATPVVFPPHPPLQSGGWYHASTVEAPGPGRPPVGTPGERSTGAAVLFSALFGPLGLWYLSAGAGLAATVLGAVVVSLAGPPSLLLLWPLSVAAAVLGVRLARQERTVVVPRQPLRPRTARNAMAPAGGQRLSRP